MPSRRNSIANTQHPTPLRRSSRIQQLQQQQQQQQQPEEEHSTNPKSKSRTSFGKPPSGPSLSSTSNVFAKKIQRGDPERDTKTSIGSRNCENSTCGLRRSPRLSIGVDEISCLRRSPKYFYKENTENVVQKARNDTSVRVADKEVKLGVGKAKVGVDSCQQVVKKPGMKLGVEGVSCVRRSPRFSHKEDTQRVVEKVKIDKPVRVTEKKVKAGVGNAKGGSNSCKNCAKTKEMGLRSSRVESVTVEVEAGERKVRDADKGNKEIGVKRKRKRGEEGDRILNGWTKGEEVALQRAYFSVKPTPHFWKKVAKLVPGKSAQDCFNKVHSDHSTPPQPQPRSRAKKTMSSPLGSFSLSASKLLKPTEPKIKRPCYNKQKSHLGQKAVRHLLRKHYDVDQDGADLFSVLEPNTEPSTQKVSQSILFSTPKHKVKKSGLLQHSERSSSGCKKPLSRFSCLCPTALISPPVLKQVKNRALHEKYIDQLHNREAKRKAASARATKSTPRIESRKENHFQKLDVVKAALISGARDAINQFQHLQANASVNSSELDDGVGTDTDDEGEDGP